MHHQYYHRTGTCPAASGNAGLCYAFAAQDATNTITIDGNASENIDGSATFTLAVNKAKFIMCDGTGWYSVGAN